MKRELLYWWGPLAVTTVAVAMLHDEWTWEVWGGSLLIASSLSMLVAVLRHPRPALPAGLPVEPVWVRLCRGVGFMLIGVGIAWDMDRTASPAGILLLLATFGWEKRKHLKMPKAPAGSGGTWMT